MNEIEALGYLTIILISGIIGYAIIWFIISTLEIIEVVHKTKFYKRYKKNIKKSDKEWWYNQ